MEVERKEIIYYETRDGKSPFRDWLFSLKDREGRQRIKVRIDRVSLGNLGYCESVGKGIMELKIDFGPGYRVYFGQVKNKLVILLHGGSKKFQNEDIQKAKLYWEDYNGRKR